MHLRHIEGVLKDNQRYVMNDLLVVVTYSYIKVVICMLSVCLRLFEGNL